MEIHTIPKNCDSNIPLWHFCFLFLCVILKNNDEVSKIKKYFASYVISITFAIETDQ